MTPVGITPGKNKLKAVEKAKIPEAKEEIKYFVGLCNFFRTHVKDFAKLCTQLNKATRALVAVREVRGLNPAVANLFCARK